MFTLVTAVPVVSDILPPFRVARRSTLCAVLLALNVADVVLTQIGLAVGAVEQNQLMAAAVAGGWATALLAKAVCLGLGAVALWLAPPRSRVMDAGVAACVCWYVGVVCWNLLVIAGQI